MFDFKEFRKAKKLRQDYFVKLFNCTQGYISQLENKIKPITDDQLALLRTQFDDIDNYITNILPKNTNEDVSPSSNENTQQYKFYEELILSQQRVIENQSKTILDMQLKTTITA